MFKTVLVSATMMGVAMPVSAMATTYSLSFTGDKELDLMAGNLYEITLTYTNSFASYWDLYATTVSTNTTKTLISEGVDENLTPVSVDTFFRPTTTGLVDFKFDKGNLAGDPTVVSVNNPTIKGTFAVNAPGPAAGAGWAGFALAAMTFMGLRRRKAG